MLLDQNHHEHVVEAFRPDPNSSSFRCVESSVGKSANWIQTKRPKIAVSACDVGKLFRRKTQG